MKRIRQLSIEVEQRTLTITHQLGIEPPSAGKRNDAEGVVCPMCGSPSSAGAVLAQQQSQVDPSSAVRAPEK